MKVTLVIGIQQAQERIDGGLGDENL